MGGDGTAAGIARVPEPDKLSVAIIFGDKEITAFVRR
jgi:hypothetical protein